jgi:hypothetical protein
MGKPQGRLSAAFHARFCGEGGAVNTTWQQDAVQGEKHVALAGESSGEWGCGERLAKRSSGDEIWECAIDRIRVA